MLEATSHGYGGYVFDENMKKHAFDGYRVDCITDYALEYLDQKNGFVILNCRETLQPSRVMRGKCIRIIWGAAKVWTITSDA